MIRRMNASIVSTLSLSAIRVSVPSYTEGRRSPAVTDDPLKLKSIHHVEFWVGNAKQAAYFYRHAFGFSQIAYAGLETGHRGPFLPGFTTREVPGDSVGVLRVDHIVGNVELGKMNEWADWYSRVLGFRRFISFDDKDISTEYSALMSIVMSDDSFSIKFPINEPAEGRKKSQIQEYLDFHHGPGVQHIALLTSDIIETVTQLRRNGVEFLRVPDTYYEELPGRVGEVRESIESLQSLGILVDRDEDGYLLQIFTQPVEDRP